MRTSLIARVGVTLGVLITTVAVGASSASATRAGDPRSQRDAVRKQQAAVAAQLNVTKASDAQVKSALDALNANVAAQQAAVADAQRASTAAAHSAEVAKAAEVAAQQQLDALKAELRELAIAAYINPDVQSGGFDTLASHDISEAVTRQALIGLRAGGNIDLTDRVQTAKDDLTTKREAADNALEQAKSTQQAVEKKLSDLNAAQQQQRKVVADVDARLNSMLAEAANLAALDQNLSNQIAAQEAALAAARARAAVSRGSGGGGGGGRVVGNITLATVHGITVAASIADNLAALLDAAAADGFVFGGGGYRDTADQVALRRAHCGTSDYDIYDKPAGECHPPTAPPGSSMHEQGLAVDFTWNGSVISSRSSPAFQWLAAHAGRYGFYNLPSEPWHWSTNGN